jgi:t-SNARE complex subunit (syntaxin)
LIANIKLTYDHHNISEIELQIDSAMLEIRNLIDEAAHLIHRIKALKLDDFKQKQQSLVSCVNDMIKEQIDIKNAYKKDIANTLIRRGKILMPGIPDQKLEDMAMNAPSTFRDMITITIASDEAQTAYSDAIERSREVEVLTRSIHELNELMRDLSTLITEQSTTLTRIGDNVELAVVNVGKGNKAMDDAIQYQKKTRKCYCCICSSLIIVIIVILGITLPTLNAFNYF